MASLANPLSLGFYTSRQVYPVSYDQYAGVQAYVLMDTYPVTRGRIGKLENKTISQSENIKP